MNFDDVDFNDPASVFAAMGITGGPGGLPLPKMISPEKVKREARGHVDRIFRDREILNKILERHEATIHKRWDKKSRNQRVAVLLSAWPKMSASHRPDFAAFRKETERQREAGTKFRDAYMWPQINLDDLSKPKTLLLLMQSRARNRPDVFAMADSNVAHLGKVTKAIVPAFLNEYTMMFTNRSTPETYGELVSWDDNEDAFFLMQEKIMHFLVDCCKQIMHDIPVSDLASDKFPTQPAVTLAKDTVDGFDSLAIMASETPYRPPASMDLERLESVIQAKKSSVEDHVWALREDPEYFANSLPEYEQHRQELLKDSNGHVHPLLKTGNEGVFWKRVIDNIIPRAHIQLEVWSELHTQVKELIALKSKYQQDISIDKELPEEYLNALLKFRHYLNQAAKGPQSELKHSLVASPPLRQFFERIPPSDPNSTMIQITQKKTAKLDKTQSELMWLCQTLWEDGQNLFLAGLTNIVDELGRLIQSEPKAKDLISPTIADILSDLSVISEGLRQLQMYQPWAQTFEDSLVEKEKGIKKEFAQRTKNWSLVMDAIEGPNNATIVRLGQPSGRKFHYPAEKRRTKESVEAMRLAEKNLDEFWQAVDQNMRSRSGKRLESTALWHFLSQERILVRTPKWVDPQKEMEKQESVDDVDALIKPLSEIYFERELKTERTIGRGTPSAQLAAKVKTRGTAAPATAHNDNTRADANQEQSDIQPKFELDAGTLKVFRALFYTPSLTATPGEVPWRDFLHAMKAVGFQPQKLYGSVWQFSPTDLDVERAIQFHEPHPSGKLPYRTARRIGRRLNRAYGWERGMFVPQM
ncbi:hypothetical protein CC80DRAFT_528569 [Byssothecium circinans]|uniref:Uncharacterized protein n=1 Tax=Byssothecium circinans TaxID=147558 RepID=A0A6A5TFV0_9PLEO|nr:hypothetical protein CC80DRAFT_528569 [Byssothecium circinans]